MADPADDATLPSPTETPASDDATAPQTGGDGGDRWTSAA
jgi:hypothetical protein